MRARLLLLFTLTVALTSCASPEGGMRSEFLCYPGPGYAIRGPLHCYSLPDLKLVQRPQPGVIQHRTGAYADLIVSQIRCTDQHGSFVPRVIVANTSATPAGAFDVVTTFTITPADPSAMPLVVSFTGRISGVQMGTPQPVDFRQMTIPLEAGDTLKISATADPALFAPRFLLWGEVLELDETNNTSEATCTVTR